MALEPSPVPRLWKIASIKDISGLSFENSLHLDFLFFGFGHATSRSKGL
jgi:hypothetical protein